MSRGSGEASSSPRGSSRSDEPAAGPVWGHPWAVAPPPSSAALGGGGHSLGLSGDDRAAMARLPGLAAAACLAALGDERCDTAPQTPCWTAAAAAAGSAPAAASRSHSRAAPWRSAAAGAPARPSRRLTAASSAAAAAADEGGGASGALGPPPQPPGRRHCANQGRYGSSSGFSSGSHSVPEPGNGVLRAVQLLLAPSPALAARPKPVLARRGRRARGGAGGPSHRLGFVRGQRPAAVRGSGGGGGGGGPRGGGLGRGGHQGRATAACKRQVGGVGAARVRVGAARGPSRPQRHGPVGLTAALRHGAGE